jgi:uncharacterized protein
MPLTAGFISVDDHVQEHPQVWTDRMSQAKWGDRIPHVVETPAGDERWVIDGKVRWPNRVASAAALMPDRNHEPQRWDQVPRAAYDPHERLTAMDAAGITHSVLYPAVAGEAGQQFGAAADPAFELACVQAYNDWLIDEWVSASARFVPQCIVPIAPIEATVAEIRRAVGRGHRGVVYPAVPMHLRDVPHLNNLDYDPIWSTCAELGVPLCFHAGASPRLQYPAYTGLADELAGALGAATAPASSAIVLVNLLCSRILLRHPDLRVIFGESALGWGAFLLEYADHQFEQDRVQNYELKPSEMFRRQCYLTGWYEPVAGHIEYLGAPNLLWATQFPLASSTWPSTRKTIEHCFVDVPAEPQRQILWGNAAGLYGLC